MTNEELKQALDGTQNGANYIASWERPCKLRKAFGTMPLTKRTVMLVRVGVQYDAIKVVQEGREDGTLPAENAGLKGWEWINYPLTIKNLRNGKPYLRMESGTFNVKAEVKYFLDGQEIAFEDYKHTMLASEYPKPKKDHLTFNVPVDAILSIHKYVAAKNEVEEGEAEGEPN